MPSFDEFPTEFVDLNEYFPELSSKVGLSHEQVRAIIENIYWNYNHLNQADIDVGTVSVEYAAAGSPFDVDVTHTGQYDDHGCLIKDFLNFVFTMAVAKITTTASATQGQTSSDIAATVTPTELSDHSGYNLDFAFTIPRGAQGEQGVSFRNRGAYDSTQVYVSNNTYIDFVSYQGSLYAPIVAQTTAGVLPTNTSQWSLMVRRGYGIMSVNKTSTSGLVDTYTITFEDGTTTTFDVTNGATPDVSGKADKVANATAGNIATLDANGNLADGGVAPTELQTLIDSTHKLNADLVDDTNSNNKFVDNTYIKTTKETGVEVHGSIKDVYKTDKGTIYIPQGLIMGGTAQSAGLATRGISGSSVPTATGMASKQNLFINYDGDNIFKADRQVVLQADRVGAHLGNNMYQYAVPRGEIVKDYCDEHYASLSDLEDKQDVLQYSTMPTASASNEGDIIQYTGATDSTYTSGHFYKCVEDSGNYGWEEIEFGGSAPSNMVTTDTDQTITGIKTIPTLNTTNLTASNDINPVVKCLSYSTSYLTGAYRGIETTYDKISFVHGGSTSQYIPSAYVQFKPNLSHEYAGMSYYTRNSSGTMVERLSTDWVQIYLTGNQIIAKVNDNSMAQGQVVTCTANSTDANVSYKANHIYKFTYANDVWTATDITPTGEDLTGRIIPSLAYGEFGTNGLELIGKNLIFKQDASTTNSIIRSNGVMRKSGNSQEMITWDSTVRAVSSMPRGDIFYEHSPLLYIGNTNSQYTKYHTYIGTLQNPETEEEYWEWVDVTAKGSAPTVLTDVEASDWVSDDTYPDYAYKCELSVSGVTANDLAEVTFGVAEATSGNYAPVTETDEDVVIIYSKVDDTITIPTIKVEKL